MATDFTLLIEKLVPGGAGLGRRQDGLVVLSHRVLPGETVRVRGGRRHRDYQEADLLEVLDPSPERQAAACPFFGTCGGCDLQHATAAGQLRIKRQMLAESLLRAGLDPGLEIREVLASPKPFGYRQRVRLQVDGDRRLGFHRQRSRAVVAIDHCPLAAPELNELLKTLAGGAPLNSLLACTDSLELSLCPETRRVALLFGFTRKPRPADCRAARQLTADLPGQVICLFNAAGQGLFDADGSRLDHGDLQFCTLPAEITGRGPLTLAWEVGGFSQVNVEQNMALIRLVLGWAAPKTGQQILDLYCGMGNFSLPLALHGAEVLGIEGQGSAVRSGRRNAERNGLANCRFEKAAVEKGVDRLLAAGARFDTILLDPPRAGAPDIVGRLHAFEARRVIAISCDPATLARDLATLQAGGYQVRTVQPVDMFPQTHHLESCALLERP